MADSATILNALSIPGNAKQRYLPFCLNPENDILKKQEVDISKNVGGTPQLFTFKGKPQLFTFKGKNLTKDSFIEGNSAVIGVCPSAIYLTAFKKLLNHDMSFQSLYRKETGYGSGIVPAQVKMGSLLDNMPNVQIREYTPDVRLDQFMHFVRMLIAIAPKLSAGSLDALVSGFKKGFGEAQKMEMGNLVNSVVTGAYTASEEYVKKVGNNLDTFLKFITGTQDTDFYGKAAVELPDWAPNWNIFKKDSAVLDVPFMLYYLLQSQVTTNVYELPFVPDSLFDLAGQNGWKGAGRFDPTNDFLSGILRKMPGVGNMINSAFSHIRINYMSSWNAGEGSTGPDPSFTVKFSLFNDCLGAALSNFIFVNTIAPNNMWMQYGLLQQSPSVYDVKVSGLQRLYMCGANVKVANKGVLRRPSQQFMKDLFSKHVNGNAVENDNYQNFNWNDQIRIPDVYEVSIEFKSMFPMNVNNYLYQYSRNNKIVNSGYPKATNINSPYYAGSLDAVVAALSGSSGYKDLVK